MGDSVLFDRSDRVGILKINRPDVLNALNREIVSGIDGFIDLVRADEELKVLIFTGEKNFAAGADILEMVDLIPDEAAAFSFSSTFDKIAALNIPTIAAVEGYALGGGLELALACDFRIAARSAKLGLPEITLGIMPGAGGTIRLPRLAGYSKALEMILLGNLISAEQAEKIGLVNAVTEDADLMETAMAWAEKLKKRPGKAVALAIETVRAGLSKGSVAEGIALEAGNWKALFETEDQREGMRAFIEKRKPKFKDK